MPDDLGRFSLTLPEFRRLAVTQLEEATALKEEGNDALKRGDAELAQHRYIETVELLDELAVTAPDALKRPDFADLAKRASLLRQTAEGNLAQALLREKRYGEAVRAAERAVKRGDGNAKILFRLAQARRGLGESDEAREALRQARKLAPDSVDIVKALREVEAEIAEALKRQRGRFGGMFTSEKYQSNVHARAEEERRLAADERGGAWRAIASYAHDDEEEDQQQQQQQQQDSSPEPLRRWLAGEENSADAAAIDIVTAALLRVVSREDDGNSQGKASMTISRAVRDALDRHGMRDAVREYKLAFQRKHPDYLTDFDSGPKEETVLLEGSALDKFREQQYLAEVARIAEKTRRGDHLDDEEVRVLTRYRDEEIARLEKKSASGESTSQEEVMTLNKLKERKSYEARQESDAQKQLERVDALVEKSKRGERITFYERLEMHRTMEREAARLEAKDDEMGLDDAELRAYRKLRAQLDERKAKEEQQRRRREAYKTSSEQTA